MRLKIAVAERQPHISVMLREYRGVYDVDIVGIASSGIGLSALIESGTPDIVIMEIDFPDLNGLDIVKIHKNKCMRMDFIVIAEKEDFDQAIQGLRAGISDLLVKPVTYEKLFNALHASLARELSRIVHIHDNDFALRCYYTSNLSVLLADNMSMEATNLHYGTRYKKGIFRCAFAKVDCTTGIEWFANNTVYMEKIKSIFFEELSGLCHELLFEPKFDGILALMNYSFEAAELVRGCLEKVQLKMELLFNALYEIKITLCVGKEYDTMGGLSLMPAGSSLYFSGISSCAAIGIEVEINAYETALFNNYKNEQDEWEMLIDLKNGSGYIPNCWRSCFDRTAFSNELTVNFVKDDRLQELVMAAKSPETYSPSALDEFHEYLKEKAYGYGLFVTYDYAVAVDGIEDIFINTSNYICPGAFTYSSDFEGVAQ